MTPLSLMNTRLVVRAMPEASGNRLIYIISSIILTLLFIVGIAYLPETTFDDAYMYIRYADNILAGHGHVWNIGESAIYGSTSPFFCLWVTLHRALLSLDPAGILSIASALPGIFSVALLARINSHTLQYGNYWKWYTFYLLVFAVCSPFVYHSHTGMDTSFALFFNIVLIYAGLTYLKEESYKTFVALLAAAMLSFEARPDNLIVSLLFPALLMLFFKQKGLRKAIIFCLGIALLLVIDTGIKYWLLNDPLPLAFYAKRNGFYQGYIGLYQWNTVFFLLWFIASSAIHLVLTKRIWDKKTILLAVVFIAPLFLTFSYYMTVVQIMGHAARYYFPFLPFVAIFAFSTNINDKLLAKPYVWHVVGKAFIYILVIVSVSFLSIDPYANYLKSQQVKITPKTSYQMAAKKPLPYLSRVFIIDLLSESFADLAAGTKVVISEYGQVGAFANQLVIIDPIGLHDKEIAHQGVSMDKVLARSPDIIVMVHTHYTKLYSDMIDNPVFQANYDFYPQAFRHGIAINRTYLQSDSNNEWFKQLWRDAYGDLDSNLYKADFQGGGLTRNQ